MAAPQALIIDQWYDRSERVWITVVKDKATGYQVGDAEVDGTKADARVARRWLRAQIKNGTIR